MSRRALVRAVIGALLLALAVLTLALMRGTGQAAGAFREQQAVWQRGLAPVRPTEPGAAQRAGEALLGIEARSDVQRAYAEYRAGLADVIPGTTYPQAQARFEAIQRLRRLRASLGSPRDRASADIVMGVVLVGGASGAGGQGQAQLAKALALFTRAVREDPTNATAKLDLEVLLRATAPRSKSRPSPAGSPRRQRQREQNPRTPTAPSRAEGNGF